jgi:hypothetical protein
MAVCCASLARLVHCKTYGRGFPAEVERACDEVVLSTVVTAPATTVAAVLQRQRQQVHSVVPRAGSEL